MLGSRQADERRIIHMLFYNFLNPLTLPTSHLCVLYLLALAFRCGPQGGVTSNWERPKFPTFYNLDKKLSNLGRGFVSGTAAFGEGSRRLCVGMGTLPALGHNPEKVGRTAPVTLGDGQAQGGGALRPRGLSRQAWSTVLHPTRSDNDRTRGLCQCPPSKQGLEREWLHSVASASGWVSRDTSPRLLWDSSWLNDRKAGAKSGGEPRALGSWQGEAQRSLICLHGHQPEGPAAENCLQRMKDGAVAPH